MSSQTPNLNLVLPVGTEKVSRQIINDNNTKIDTAVGANSTAIANNATSIECYRNPQGTLKRITSVDLNTFYQSGRYYCSSCTNTPSNSNGYLDVYVYNVASGNNYIRQSFRMPTTNDIYERVISGSTWSSWELLAKRSEITEKIFSLYLTEQVINSGYFSLNYPTGITYETHNIIAQQVYSGGTSPGYVFTVQQQASNLIVYVRTVITENGVPADGSKVSLLLLFIKK